MDNGHFLVGTQGGLAASQDALGKGLAVTELLVEVVIVTALLVAVVHIRHHAAVTRESSTALTFLITDRGFLTAAVIIGHNETLPTILRDLPENVVRVYLAGAEMTAKEQQKAERIAAAREIDIVYCDGDLQSEEFLLELAKKAPHIVILNDHGREEEAADMETIFRLLNLRDIRTRFGLEYNLTVEMQKEHNQYLVGRGDHTDFLVTSSMSSLFLAQLAESPELFDVFRELLSNNGNELYLKPAAALGLPGVHSVRDLRRRALRMGYILLGCRDEESGSRFNLPLEAELMLRDTDEIIVLGEK